MKTASKVQQRRLLGKGLAAAVAVISAIAVLGCASSGGSGARPGYVKEEYVALTPSLIKLIGEDFKFVSVFVSSPLRLERESFEVDADLVIQPDGSVRRVNKRISDVVEIPADDRGAITRQEVVEVSHVEYHVIGVEFENQPDLIGFAADLNSPHSRYYLQFDNDEKLLMRYMGNDYFVRYGSKELPYLAVKVGSQLTEENSRRVASREWIFNTGAAGEGE